ncbi:hypothetical protein ABIB06_006553 [Bradyrhizobium sp. LB8.2]|uniref:DnaT-like ssDNA-binding protein n=1 Tax=unclassified Bradyrhizobium TaxID=2631580 RepID=UPI00339B9134
MQVGVDAYASVQEVTTYLSARGASTAWAAATTQAKEAAIIEATSFLDVSFKWKGAIADITQTLGWPRDCVWDREGRLLEDIPTIIKNATAELANLALGGRLQPMELVSSGGAVKSERIGDVQVDYDLTQVSAQYDYLRTMLRGIGGMSTTTGMAKLVRT